MDTQPTPLARAIGVAGNRKRLAEKLKITPQALSQWGQVPALRVLDVERVTGVPRHELRPDLYPPPNEQFGHLTEASAA